jgi:(E)-4-hydroxy-3-methyl-but-2-enyl pyrophosphate reductase
MKVILAKTAGFCFGVNRAVELTGALLDGGHKVATLGPLIHNPQVVAGMEARGAVTADSVADVPAGYEVVIRSHGVPRSVYDAIAARGIVCHDATCPFVAKIHRIAEQAQKEGAVLLVAGMRPIPKYRELWAIPAEKYSFSAICPHCRPGRVRKYSERPYTPWRRPPFR